MREEKEVGGSSDTIFVTVPLLDWREETQGDVEALLQYTYSRRFHVKDFVSVCLDGECDVFPSLLTQKNLLDCTSCSHLLVKRENGDFASVSR